MNDHDLYFILSAFVAEAIGTVSGFGSSTFFVPIAQMLESFHLVLVLTSILHCFGNSSRIYLFRKDLDWKLFIKFAVPSIVFTVIGALLTKYFDVTLLKKFLGVGLIIIAVIIYLDRQKYKITNPIVLSILTAISGFLTGFIGTGGAIRGVALASLNIEKNIFIALSSSVDLGGDFLRMLIYFKNGYMDWQQWWYIPLLGLSGYLGAKVGQKIVKHIEQKIFYKIVAVFVFLSGVGLLL